MGLLSNVDSSILKINFDHGFKVEGRPDNGQFQVRTNNYPNDTLNYKEVAHLIYHLEGLPLMEVYKKLDPELSCLNTSEKKIYVITNSLEIDIKMNDKRISKNLPSEVAKFDNNFVHGYLYPRIRLMRLFKEGNISMPLIYYYFIDNDIPEPYMRMSTSLYVLKEPYTLESLEIPELRTFIQNTKLPFAKPFLQLAFENFELSYQISDINLSFLVLMISLETLFNLGHQELRYRVSRNAAVLLGKENGDSKNIFSKIKKLYDKRSKFVHTGESNIINREDLLKLRYYVRESIKEINKIDKNKDELIDLLNSCGFGERPWRK
jgi:hypothetical protein